MNVRRLVLGGMLAGLTYNILGIALAALLGLPAAFARLGLRPTPLVGLLHLGMRFGYGFVSVFLYAAVRPRFGAGPRTAVTVGLLIWLIAYVPLTVLMTELQILTPAQGAVGVAWGLFETTLATGLGAYLYRE